MELLFSNKVSKEFSDKVISESKKLPIEPSWIMLVMQLESGLNPQAVNPISNATGLIQFIPSTAVELGTTVGQLLNMSGVEQLDYVFKYLKNVQQRQGRYSTYFDVYLSIFYPYSISQDDDYVMGSERGLAYAQTVARQNPTFDVSKDGTITKGEFRKWFEGKVYALVPTAYYDTFFKKKTSFSSINQKSYSGEQLELA